MTRGGAVLRRWWAQHPMVVDVAAAFLLAVSAELEVWLSDVAEKPLYAVVALAFTLPLPWRRRYPLAVLVAIMAALTLLSARGTDFFTTAQFVAMLVAMYSVAAHCELRRASLGLVLANAASLLNVLRVPQADSGDFIFPPILLTTPWLGGRALRVWRSRAAELEDLARKLERERGERARLAVADERARIAREMHDVLAHSVSVMVVQAGAGQRVLKGEHARVAGALAAIEVTGRHALGEMRRLLSLLREGDELAFAPQPGLEQLEALAERTSQAGLPVELRVEGQARPLPAGVDLSAYRIVQEALTNALKHAGPTRTRVTVRYGERDIDLEVSDEGGVPAGNGAAGQGHGLVGMRERVALYGGVLRAGHRPEGGYSVTARLPAQPKLP